MAKHLVISYITHTYAALIDDADSVEEATVMWDSADPGLCIDQEVQDRLEVYEVDEDYEIESDFS